MPKTCDLCGLQDYNCTEVFEHFQKDGVKVICYDCATVVNRYGNAVHAFAEKQAVKAQAEMLARLDKVERDKRRVKSFWFFVNIRSLFQRRVIHAAFEIGRPKEADRG